MDMEPPNRTPGSGKPQVPGAKRQRILNACNQCRKRKVRCDEAQPRCRFVSPTPNQDILKTTEPFFHMFLGRHLEE
jgi:hypothetical protein